MKVYRCDNAPVKASPKKLSWDEIIKAEGVYKLADCEDKDYFIVLRLGEISSVLYYYYQEGVLEPPDSTWGMGSYLFVRVENARVCFEIKED